MTTLNEIIAIIKTENPTIQIGDDNAGYRELTSDEYNAQVLDWSNARLAKELKLAKADAAKASALAKLAALGLTTDDLEALGL